MTYEQEVVRRDRAINPARKQKHKLTRMMPTLSAANKYGLGLGLPELALATHFGLDPVAVRRVNNGRRW